MKREHLPFILLFLMSLSSCCCATENVISEKTTLNESWEIQQSTIANQSGEVLSSSSANTDGWYPASVPSTIMGTLTKNGLYEDLLIHKNYAKADRTPFDVSWWYRTSFDVPNYQKGEYVTLLFEGITYRANIWFNGVKIASKEDTFGTFCRFSYDVTDYMQDDNVIAVEVFRAQDAEPNIGFVDWNPRPLDESMGIFRDVIVSVTGDVKMENTRVVSDLNIETLDKAELTVETELTNLSNKDVVGSLMAEIKNRSTGKTIDFSIPVQLKALESKIVSVNSEDIDVLSIDNPSIWWCNNMGDPNLYDINLRYVIGDVVSAQEDEAFGIRDIETYFTADGHRGFMLNGEKVLIKSAGWTDDIFLRDTYETNEIQVKYVKDMNLNQIRFENIWGTSRDIYDLCDEYGLLSFVGWSCHWEWSSYFKGPDDEFGCIRSEEDFQLLTRYFNDQVLWLRNHPSIIAWLGGSDKLLQPELERRYLELLSRIDDRPYVGAAKQHTSSVTGESGLKMLGPYEYVGPNYWFIDTQFGGAYGFNSETGPGPELPILESIEKMIPKDKLWPINEYWDYHCTTSATHLNNLDVLNEAMDTMFGESSDVSDYLRKAHLMNYQSTKSMFEAFRVNLPNTTGIVQWMLNSAWPSLYWQLYDYYMIPVPAYYGVKKANMPTQIIYNYKDNGIYVVSEGVGDMKNLRAEIREYDANSSLIQNKELNLSIDKDSVAKIFTIANKIKNTFLSLKIYDQDNNMIADNFYLLSSKADTYDWDKTDWCTTPMLSYGDFRAIPKIKDADVEVNFSKNSDYLTVVVENNSSVISFFNHIYIKDSAGEVVYPVYWEDNYISLLPGEKREIKCEWDKSFAERDDLKLNVVGWNLKRQIMDI